MVDIAEKIRDRFIKQGRTYAEATRDANRWVEGNFQVKGPLKEEVESIGRVIVQKSCCFACMVEESGEYCTVRR